MKAEMGLVTDPLFLSESLWERKAGKQGGAEFQRPGALPLLCSF